MFICWALGGVPWPLHLQGWRSSQNCCHAVLANTMDPPCSAWLAWPHRLLPLLHQQLWRHQRATNSPQACCLPVDCCGGYSLRGFEVALTSWLVLQLLGITAPFIIDCDASGAGFGVVLSSRLVQSVHGAPAFQTCHLRARAHWPGEDCAALEVYVWARPVETEEWVPNSLSN